MRLQIYLATSKPPMNRVAKAYHPPVALLLVSGAAIAVAFWAAKRVNERLKDIASAYDDRPQDERERAAFGDAKRKAGFIFGQQPPI